MLRLNLLLAIVLAVAVSLSLSQVSAVTLSAADNEAKKEIVTNMSNAVDHRYSQYDLILGSKIGDNSTFVVYNKTAENPIPPVACGSGTELKNGVCVPIVPVVNETTPVQNETGNVTPPAPEPEPQPTPTNETTKIVFGADFSGNDVINVIKARNADLNIANGDLGYKSDLSGFKAVWNNVKNHHCTIGNHDSPEDGNSAIYAEAKAYCGDIWIEKIAGGSTVIIGFNSNGNLDTQLGTAQDYVMGNAMVGVKNVILSDHKPCKTPPNSHHTVESNVKTFCDSLIAKIPAGVNVYGVAGHNHVLATDGNFFISGGGGKSHYPCGTGSGWTMCKSIDGFLELVIKDGKITPAFYDISGGVVK